MKKQNIQKKFTGLINQWNKSWEKFLNLKYIQKIFLFLPHNFFLFLLFLISIILIVTFDYNQTIPLYSYEGVADGAFDGIVDEPLTFSLEQIDKDDIEETGKNPDRICLRFATFGKKTNSEYKYIVHKNGEIVYEENFNSHRLEDSKYSCFYLPGASKENIQEYSIEIAPVRTNVKNMITLFKNTKNGDVDLMLGYEPSTFLIKSIFVLVFFVLYFTVNYFINTKKMSIEKFWLFISIVFIVPITIINPPYEVPDEPIHFYNAYRLTQFDKDKNFYENLENQYMTMPESIGCLGYAKIQRRDKVINPNEVAECFKNTNNTIKKSSYVFVGSRIAFFASAFGIKVADIFTNSPGIIFYMGRLFATLFSIFVIYQALKIAPKHKEFLLLMATVPIFIQQMISYSYDAILNTFSLLATAILIRMIYDKDANWKLYTPILFLCGMFIANIKMIYLPIFLFLLFVPNEKFNRKIDKYIYTFAIILMSYLLGEFSKALIGSGDIETILSSLFTIIALGVTLKMILEEKTNWKIFLPILGICSVILGFMNPLYLLLIFLLLFFIPNNKFKKKWHKYVGFIIAFVLTLILGKILISLFTTTNIEEVAEVVSSPSRAVIRITDLILHPMKAITLAYSTLKMKTAFYARSLIGYFGWFTFHLNDLYVFAYFLFALYILRNTSFVKTKWYEKGIVFLGILVGILGIFLAMYVYWSGPDLYYIDGVQGRYFIPAVVPILLLLTTSKKKKQNPNLEKNTYSFIAIVLLEYISLLLLFYY